MAEITRAGRVLTYHYPRMRLFRCAVVVDTVIALLHDRVSATSALDSVRRCARTDGRRERASSAVKEMSATPRQSRLMSKLRKVALPFHR